MITYKNIERPEVTAALFDGFDRYQEVKKCWRKIGGAWILKDIAFIEQWNEQEYAYLAQCLRRTTRNGRRCCWCVYGWRSGWICVG